MHSKEKYRKKINYPKCAENNYHYWHSNTDWLNQGEHILTYPINAKGEQKTKVRFLKGNGEYTKKKKLKKDYKKVDDTWFYNIET